MSISEYAIAIANLSRWTAGEIDDSTAYYHWEQLMKGGYTLVAVPDKQNWPSQLKRPKTEQDPDPGVWGTWKHLVAAVSPIGFVALLLGDEAFRQEVAAAAGEGASAAAAAAKGGLTSLLPWVGLGVLGYLYLRERR